MRCDTDCLRPVSNKEQESYQGQSNDREEQDRQHSVPLTAHTLEDYILSISIRSASSIATLGHHPPGTMETGCAIIAQAKAPQRSYFVLTGNRVLP